MAFRIKLDEQSAIKAINKVAQEYRKDTKSTVKSKRIWRTGDLCSSIDILQKARKVGSQIFAVLGIKNEKLKHGKSRRGVSYPKYVHDGASYKTRSLIPRPFFDWTYKSKESKYDQIISEGIKLK